MQPVEKIEIAKPMESKWIRADSLWSRISGSMFFSTEEKKKIQFMIETEPGKDTTKKGEKEEQNMAQNIIGERIAGLLREQGKSQRKLAEQAGTTGASISRYIKGNRVPTGPVLANIAEALHTTTDYLLGNEQDSNDTDLLKLFLNSFYGISSSPSDFEYNYTQRVIARNANRWSKKQKLALVNALFGMSDLISRQAAIDAIERNAYRHTYIDQIVDIIKGLPSAQPEQQWIPCSERLPEKGGQYLVTRGHKSCGNLWNRVYILNYSDLMGLKKEKIWWSGNVGKSDFEKFNDVIAWMPLPEPYREDEE